MKLKLRSEKTCLNCGHLVEDRFCSHCGQENRENRPSFWFLFVEFFSSIFSYEGNFWRTLKILFFKPGVVVNEYLIGKRKSYIHPIRLYFFSALFAVGSGQLMNMVFPDKPKKELTQAELVQTSDAFTRKAIMLSTLDSIQKQLPEAQKIDSASYSKIKKHLDKQANPKSTGLILMYQTNEKGEQKKIEILPLEKLDRYQHVRSLRQFDSIDRTLSKDQRLPFLNRQLYRQALKISDHGFTSNEMMSERFKETFFKNFPKVLIIYLPLFALVLLLFYNKKKWKYYDHGIFTLFFFSFVLCSFGLMNILLDPIAEVIDFTNGTVFQKLVLLIPIISIILYVLYYYFRSQRIVYKEKWGKLILKGFTMGLLNTLLFSLILLIFTVVTFFML